MTSGTRHNYSEAELKEFDERIRQCPQELGIYWQEAYAPKFTDVSRLHPALVAAANDWNYEKHSEHARPGLGFVGPTGIGKTRAIFLALQRAAFNNPSINQHGHVSGPQIAFVNDPDFATCALNRTNYGDEDARDEAVEFLERYRDADILFYDDFGQAKYTERVQAELYTVIEHRTSAFLPILWTSNLDAKGLVGKFGDPRRGAAIVRRLSEFSTIVKIE